jgi:hypothetical protein
MALPVVRCQRVNGGECWVSQYDSETKRYNTGKSTESSPRPGVFICQSVGLKPFYKDGVIQKELEIEMKTIEL